VKLPSPSLLFRWRIFSFTLLCVLSLLPGISWAQEYRGTITSQVTDPSGNVIPNAAIHVASQEQTYNGRTDSKGSFYIPFVQPGTYKISAEAPGFKTVVHDGVVIDVSAKISQAFSLPVGQVDQMVSVDSDALQLSTADASGGTVMDPESRKIFET
jgi:Carboxypeptidase regulatory-like domain